jgi:hypothetical protein
MEDAEDPPQPSSNMLIDVVRIALAKAERTFSAALNRINIEDMAASAERRI